MALPLDYQKSWAELTEKAGHRVRLFELETGHAPHLMATQEVVNIVYEVVGQQ